MLTIDFKFGEVIKGLITITACLLGRSEDSRQKGKWRDEKNRIFSCHVGCHYNRSCDFLAAGRRWRFGVVAASRFMVRLNGG